MQNKTISFLQTLYDSEQSGFRFHPQGNVTLLSTCFGIQTTYLIDQMNIVDCEKTGNYLLNQQRDDGIFVDRTFNHNQLSGLQSPEYIEWQFTFFSLIALDMLGVSPARELSFLKVFRNNDYLRQWLDERNWNDFWYCSNEIMFLLYFFTYSGDKSGEGEAESWNDSIAQVFEYLDKKQDEKTGYWGRDVRANPQNGMFGAAHIYLFYRFFGKEIKYEKQITLSTLALQLTDGLYQSHGGGACEDYDGAEILFRMFTACPELHPEIRESLLLTLHRITTGIDSSGGYPYRFPENTPVSSIKRGINRILGRTTYCYSGWSVMECDMYYPDIWGTYFRLMTIALIEIALELPESFPYKSYSLPGWGYLKAVH